MVYFVQEKRGFTENELKLTLEQFTGRDLTSFFEKYINGTEIIPYASIFDKVGVTVKDATSETYSFGAAFTTSGGNVTVKSVRTNSAAELCGLSVGDEILGCNGYRADQYFLEDIISEMGATGKAELLVSRDQKLFSVSINNSLYVKPQFQFSANSTSSNASLYNFWLR